MTKAIGKVRMNSDLESIIRARITEPMPKKELEDYIAEKEDNLSQNYPLLLDVKKLKRMWVFWLFSYDLVSNSESSRFSR